MGGEDYPGGATPKNVSWDDYVRWDPSDKEGDNLNDDIISIILNSMFTRGTRTFFLLLVTQHALLVLKGYIDLMIPTESPSVKQHAELVDDVLRKYKVHEREHMIAN